MTVVIADTSALQYLHQLGVLELLPSLFATVLVPDAVRDELHQRGFRITDAVRARVLQLAGE